ncbi:MAG TPA: TetR/AcrR family transcriptional regulator [Microbacteriaceae bacterium]
MSTTVVSGAATTAATTRPLRADAQRNYDTIVRVAGEAFAENGTQTSLDDIACRAGVGPGTLYRHFPTRDSLLAAALRDSLAELETLSLELMTADDAGDALDRWLFQLASHLRTYGGLPDSIAQALRDGESPLCISCVPLRSITETLVEGAQKAGTVRDAVSAADVFALVASLAWGADRRGGSDEDLKRMLSLVTTGLR